MKNKKIPLNSGFSLEREVMALRESTNLALGEVKSLRHFILLRDDHDADHRRGQCVMRLRGEISRCGKDSRPLGWERAWATIKCKNCRREEILMSSSAESIRSYLKGQKKRRTYMVWQLLEKSGNIRRRLLEDSLGAASTEDALIMARRKHFNLSRGATPPKLEARENRL